MARTVHVIPHTHWDREWYRTFQSFRMELVELVDETVAVLDGDPDYRHFMLDGQMAVVDDYLQIRPGGEDDLARLGRDGRLLMGPWYILMDEFGVSGETIVRNMERGLARADDFGGAMDVGYLPDMFGHIAQMPQILAQFGFTDTVVWRGVPRVCTEHASFVWSAPDGSSVTAQYLPRGYGNGVGLPPTAADLVRRVELFCAGTGTSSGGPDDPVLWMHGTDHRHPLPELPAMLAEANALQDDWRFVISSLPAYVAEQRRCPGATAAGAWTGELRSGANANVLMGVTSNRVDVKQAAARAERLVERVAEPLNALFRPASEWPAAFLDIAWDRMILNSAHDSICACSHDDVVLAVSDRFAEAEAIAQGLVERAKLAAYLQAAPSLPGGDTPAAVVVNPSARTRSGLVEMMVAPDVDPEGTQELSRTPARTLSGTWPAGRALEWLGVIVDHLGEIHDATLTRTDDGVDVDLLMDQARFGLFDPTTLQSELARIGTETPDLPIRFFQVGHGGRRVLAHVDEAPGYGWTIWRPGPVDGEVHVESDGRTITNGSVTVRVDDDGSLTVNGHRGLGRIVDDGDRGDTYNFCAVEHGPVVVGLDDVTVEVVEPGPLRAILRVSGTARWPARTVGTERVGEVTTTVVTDVEVHIGEDLVRVHGRFDNNARDHRVRAHFPLPTPTDTSTGECAFGVTDRGLDAEGGPSEPALATYSSRRFVQAGGLCIVHEGLCEYELVDIAGDGVDRRARTLAVTLLRATGMLSQDPMPSRPLPAGPYVPAAAAQMPGPHEFRYGIHIGATSPYDLVDDAFVPLVMAGSGHRPDTLAAADEPVTSAQALSVTGAEVSAIHRHADDPGRLVLRVFNPSDRPTTLRVAGRTGVIVDLRGEGDEPFDGTDELGPWEIRTIHLDD